MNFDRDRFRRLNENLAQRLLSFMALGCAGLVIALGFGLWWRSRPILARYSLTELIASNVWQPLAGKFGFLPFIAGTLAVTGVAVIIACPLALLCSMYLAEYAPTSVNKLFKPLIDLLAGIPSVVYGVWGILVIVPFIKNVIAPARGIFSSGYCVLTAGIVLAVMILPVIINVSVEVFLAIPKALREAALSLGATRWQTTRSVVLRRAMPGLLAANILGLSRAFGETMAVLMVAGNLAKIPGSLFDAAYPLPALIANNYGEMMSIPLYDSALLLSALLLFGVVLIFNLTSRLVLVRINQRLR